MSEDCHGTWDERGYPSQEYEGSSSSSKASTEQPTARLLSRPGAALADESCAVRCSLAMISLLHLNRGGLPGSAGLHFWRRQVSSTPRKRRADNACPESGASKEIGQTQVERKIVTLAHRAQVEQSQKDRDIPGEGKWPGGWGCLEACSTRPGVHRGPAGMTRSLSESGTHYRDSGQAERGHGKSGSQGGMPRPHETAWQILGAVHTRLPGCSHAAGALLPPARRVHRSPGLQGILARVYCWGNVTRAAAAPRTIVSEGRCEGL